MTIDYTTTALLAAVKRKAFMPTNASLTDAEVLTIADEEMRSVVIPAFLSVREDYYIEQADFPIVANNAVINAMTDALSSTIVSVSLLDETTGHVWPLPRVTIAGIDAFAGRTGSFPSAYALQGDDIVLLPTPTSTAYSIRVRYERLPPRLVATTEAFQPTAVDTGTSTISGTVPGTWNVGSRISGWHSQPPFAASFVDARVTSASAGVSVTVDTPVSGSLADVVFNGAAPSERRDYPDYICLWNETCVVPLPDAWHPALVCAAAVAVLRNIGDDGKAATMTAERDVKIASLIKMQSNRIRKQPLVPFNRQSPTRMGADWYGVRRGS